MGSVSRVDVDCGMCDPVDFCGERGCGWFRVIFAGNVFRDDLECGMCIPVSSERMLTRKDDISLLSIFKEDQDDQKSYLVDFWL